MDKFTLTMRDYSFNFTTHESNMEVKELKNCYIYKDAENPEDIWMTTDEETSIEPGMISDDGKKIYFLKNWIYTKPFVNMSQKELHFIIYTNSHTDTPWKTVKEDIQNYVDNMITGLKHWKESM